MGGFKNFAAAAVLGESDLDDYLMSQTVMRFASAAARNTALSGFLVQGMVAYLQDTNKITAYDGTSWFTVGKATLALTPEASPFINQNNSVAFSTHHAEYTIINGICDFWFSHTCSATGAAGTGVYLNLPVAAYADLRTVGSGRIYDASTAIFDVGVWEVVSGFTTRISFICDRGGYWGGSPNIGLASGDVLTGHVRYQVAAAA